MRRGLRRFALRIVAWALCVALGRMALERTGNLWAESGLSIGCVLIVLLGEGAVNGVLALGRGLANRAKPNG